MKTSPRPAGKRAALAVVKANVICGTDFSQQAIQAVKTAAALSKRIEEPLVLVHAVNDESRMALPGKVREQLCIYERAQLREELDRLRATEVRVIEIFRNGKPHEVLLESATEWHARLLILSSHGRGAAERWMLGSVAEKVAESAPVPTLIVRDSSPFTRWICCRKRLRVVIGADASERTEAALRWVAWLRQIGSCHVVVAHLQTTPAPVGPCDAATSSVPLEMRARSGSEQAMRQRVHELLGTKGVRVRIEKDWGSSDAHLIQVAREELADLLVVGTHQRHGLARIGHHSVSRGVLHYAPMNVACVPVPPRQEQVKDENRIY